MATITAIGLETAARMIANISPAAAFIYLGNGTGSTAESINDTALEAENTAYGAERVAAECTFISPGSIQWQKLLTFSDTVVIREIGIFNALSAGEMFLRLVLPLNKNYVDGESVQITITVAASRVS